MTLDETIIDIVSEVAAVHRKEIRPEDRLREDLGLDSVSSMELLSAISERLGLDIELEDVAGVTTVAAVIELANRRAGADGMRGGR